MSSWADERLAARRRQRVVEDHHMIGERDIGHAAPAIEAGIVGALTLRTG
jgi:hypothetical protein